jgi:hypothetical protein
MALRHGLALLLTLPWLAAAAQTDALGIPPQRIEAFARALQSALQQHDTAQVADLVAYPLRINTAGKAPRQLGRAALLQQFDQVFVPSVVQQVLQQDPAALFQNYQGLMFGSGAVWANAVCPGAWRPDCPLRIIAVNRPAP